MKKSYYNSTPKRYPSYSNQNTPNNNTYYNNNNSNNRQQVNYSKQQHHPPQRGRSLDAHQERFRRDFERQQYSPPEQRYYQERDNYQQQTRREINFDAGRERLSNQKSNNNYENRNINQNYQRPLEEQRDLPLSAHSRSNTNLSADSPHSRSSPGNNTDSHLDNDRYRQRRDSRPIRGGKGPYNSHSGYNNHHHNSSYSGRGTWRGNYNDNYAGKTRGTWKPQKYYQPRYKSGNNHYSGPIVDDARSERRSVSNESRAGLNKPEEETVPRETVPSSESAGHYQVPLVEHADVEDVHHLNAARLRKALAERRCSVSQLKDDFGGPAGPLTGNNTLKTGSTALTPPPRSLEPGEITEGDDEELKSNGVRAVSRASNISKSMIPRTGEVHGDARGRAPIIQPTSPDMKIEKTGEVVMSGLPVALNTGRNTSGSPVHDTWVQDVKRGKTRSNRANSVVQDRTRSVEPRAHTQKEPILVNSEADDFLRQYADRYLRDRYDNSSNSRDQTDMDVEVNDTFQTPSRRPLGEGESDRKPPYSAPVSRQSNGFLVPEIPQRGSQDQSRYGQALQPNGRDRRAVTPTRTPSPYLPGEMTTRLENERSKSTAPAFRGRERVPSDKQFDKRRRNSSVEQESGFGWDQLPTINDYSNSRVQDLHRDLSTPMKEPTSDLYTRRATSVHASYQRNNYPDSAARRAMTPSRATGFERLRTSQDGDFPIQERKRIQGDTMARNYQDREKNMRRSSFETGMRTSQQALDYEGNGVSREPSRSRNSVRELPSRNTVLGEYSIDRRSRNDSGSMSEKVYQRQGVLNHQRPQEFHRWNERGPSDGQRFRATNHREVYATERDNRTFSVPPMSERARTQDHYVFSVDKQSARGRSIHRGNRQTFYEKRNSYNEDLKHRQIADQETDGDHREGTVERRDESMGRDQSVEMEESTSVRERSKSKKIRKSKREMKSRSSSKVLDNDHRRSSRQSSRHPSRGSRTISGKRNKRERSESESPSEATSRREPRRKVDHRQTFSISLPVINSLIATGVLKVVLPKVSSQPETAKLCFASATSSADAKLIETLEFDIDGGPQPVEQESEKRVDRGREQRQQQGQRKPVETTAEITPTSSSVTKPVEEDYIPEGNEPESHARHYEKLIRSFGDAGYLAREEHPRPPSSDRPVEFGWPMVEYVDGLVSRLRENVLTPDPENSNSNTGLSKVAGSNSPTRLASSTVPRSETEKASSMITQQPRIPSSSSPMLLARSSTTGNNVPPNSTTVLQTVCLNKKSLESSENLPSEEKNNATFETPTANKNGSMVTLTPPSFKLANGARPLMERMVYDQDNVSVEELRANYPRYVN